MSGPAPSFGSVVGGKLKLKKGASSSGAAAAATASQPQRGAAAQHVGERLAGVKRKAPTDATAAAIAIQGESKVVVAMSDAPIASVAVHAGGKTPAQRAHEEALERRVSATYALIYRRCHR